MGQTYRSKYSIQPGWEFQLPCDFLPWLVPKEEEQKEDVAVSFMPVSTLLGMSPYWSIWGNWINFQTNLEFVHLVFTLHV